MAASLEMIAEKKAILVALLTSEMQTLLLHVGTRRITSHELDLIHSLLRSMSPSYDLKDAIFYLETYDWNLTTTRLQYTFDDIDRQGPYLDEDGNSPALAQYNHSLDRAPATAPIPQEEDIKSNKHNEFDCSKFEITVNLNSDKPKTVRQATYTYPGIDSFDWHDQSCLDNLNIWRRNVFREHIGPHENGHIAAATLTPQTQYQNGIR